MKYECGKESKFQCDICQKKIHQKSNLKAHVINLCFKITRNKF